jgi:hypothetical protein
VSFFALTEMSEGAPPSCAFILYGGSMSLRGAEGAALPRLCMHSRIFCVLFESAPELSWEGCGQTKVKGSGQERAPQG